MNFRKATTEDLPQLLDLEQKVVEYERAFNADIKPENAIYYDTVGLINDVNSCLLVFEEGGEIKATGYAQLRESAHSLSHETHSYMGFMFVDVGLRGKGVNQALVQQLIEWSQGKGVNTFFLDVYAKNQSAIKAYEKIGFTASKIEMKLVT